MSTNRKRRDLSNLYQYYKKTYGINGEKLEEALSLLPEYDQVILHKRYGKNLQYPMLSKIENNERTYLCTTVISHITNLLLYGSLRRPKNAKLPETYEIKQDESNQTEEEKVNQQLQLPTSNDPDRENNKKVSMTEKDAEEILSIFDHPIFKKVYQDISIDEVSIFLLRVKSKYSTSEIANNFNITEQDVLDITKSCLIKLKRSLCDKIDEAIDVKQR